MEDKSGSEEENKNPVNSPNVSGKKLKLNDGSSHDSLQGAGSSNSETISNNEENGATDNKSSNTSHDENAASTSEGLANELENLAPSSSNVRALLLNIIRPKRNYRKRKSPGDSDSNSSTDSDDWGRSMQDSLASRQSDNSHSEPESVNMPRTLPEEYLFSVASSASNTTNTSSEGSDEPDMSQMISEDSDEDLPQSTENKQDDEEYKNKRPLVLSKSQPKHNFIMLREIIHREMGLTFPYSETSKANINFEKKFSGSLHAVYRMKRLHMLTKHKQCVNSINFHPEGNLLVSGSDDLSIIVWDWAKNKPLQTIKTGHRSNVLQSKFLHLNARSQLNIVTGARDGQVRLIQCPPSGGMAVSRRRLATHSRAVHKLQVCAAEPHLVLSCGEDGVVMQCDVRAEHATRLFQVRERGVNIALYSIDGHPYDSKELLIAGKDKCVRIYDRRKSTKPVALYCPDFFYNGHKSMRKKFQEITMHVTCAVYNYNGTEILGSYNDDDVYLFDVKNDVYDPNTKSDIPMGFTYQYSGHRNSATYKGVSFFGPRSEYIVSGSDCSHIYFWEKKTQAIVQWVQGDFNGVVNCIEEHPRFPILATSGLDRDVKIWIPRAHKDPDYDGMEKVVTENANELPSPLFNDFLPSLYTAWQADNPPRRRDQNDFDNDMCTAF